jgi:hypothetical protein
MRHTEVGVGANNFIDILLHVRPAQQTIFVRIFFFAFFFAFRA